MEILQVLVSLPLKLASKFSGQLRCVTVSLALFLVGGSSLLSLYLRISYYKHLLYMLAMVVNLNFAETVSSFQRSSTSHKYHLTSYQHVAKYNLPIEFTDKVDHTVFVCIIRCLPMAQSIVHTLYCNFIESEIYHVRNALLPSTVE